MSKNLLLLSQRAEDKAFGEAICGISELSLQVARDPQEAVKLMQEAAPPAILVDASTQSLYAAFEQAVGDTLGLFSESVQPNSIHFLSDTELGQTPFLAQSPILGSVIVRNPDDPATSGRHYGRIIRATLAGKPFGLAEVIEKTAKVQSVQIKKIADKTRVLDAIKAYLSQAKWSSRSLSIVLYSLDELLINAIYDAPQARFGASSKVAAGSAELTELEEDSKIVIDLTYDGSYFGIAVTDFYGTLDRAKLLTHIAKTFSDTEYKVKSTSSAGGIGLSSVHQTGGSLIFVIEASAKTTAMLFFKQSQSFKDFRSQFRFVSTHLYF